MAVNLLRVIRLLFVFILISILFSACGSTPVRKKVDGDLFDPGELLQSDSNRLATLSMRDNLKSLASLLDKLYRRNPIMWQRSGASSREAAVARVMMAIKKNKPLTPLGKVQGIDALNTAFSSQFGGDRAGVLVYGLGTMLRQSYGNSIEHYLVIDGLDAQQLANASYNIEVAAWMLSNKKDMDGKPMLLSNAIENGQQNLSFEREFGKIIGRLDLLAVTVDEKYRRIVINYAQGLLGVPLLEFLPVSK